MKKVLIVVKNEKTKNVLERIVEELNPNGEVYVTDDLPKAYHIMSIHTIHLFLIDLVLYPSVRGGDVSGAVFAQNVRRITRYQFTPIILFSPLLDEGLHMYAKIHCYAYIEKPFETEVVKKTIGEALKYQSHDCENRQIFFRKDGLLEALFVKDIIVAEGKDRDIYLETTTGRRMIPYRSCRTLYEQLDSPQFLFCNRSTIVNRKYVKRIDAVNGYLYMKDIDYALKMGKQTKYAFMEEIREFLI